MEQLLKLTNSDGDLLIDPSSYRRLIARLIYLIVSRLDITFTVNVLSQFMYASHVLHHLAALRVLCYLKTTLGYGLFFSSTCSFQLFTFCNFDWDSCPLTRQSTTGYVIKLGDSPLSWRTKWQPTISRYSVEAKYCSMASTTCELVWIRLLLHDIAMPHSQPALLHCDNQAAIHIARNPAFHKRTKHIELDSHLVREKIRSGLLTPSYVSASQQQADIFTKPLGRELFVFFQSKLGITDLRAPT